ncbi:hypothetical protein BHS06_14890 [Myxococcus xanthus]|nr:hypothetical protein BHS06_14890 [Myxococcus xanthus]
MTNTTTESKSQSVSPRIVDAERALRGQEFISAEALPDGLRLTGRKTLLGRTAILTEGDVIRAQSTRGPAGLRDHAMWALVRTEAGSTADAPSATSINVGDLHIDVTCDTGPAIASLEALESTLERIGPKLDRPTVTLSEVSGAITACAGALTALSEAGTRVPGEHQEKAAGCLVALVERAKQLACGAE